VRRKPQQVGRIDQDVDLLFAQPLLEVGADAGRESGGMVDRRWTADAQVDVATATIVVKPRAEQPSLALPVGPPMDHVPYGLSLELAQSHGGRLRFRISGLRDGGVADRPSSLAVKAQAIPR
jgi:hypothetical protein